MAVERTLLLISVKIAVFVSAAQGLNTADLPNETLQVPNL
jgi:hypothetical protein